MLPQHAMNPSEEGSYMTKEKFNSLLLEVFFFKKLPCEEVEENCDCCVCIESWRQTQTSPNTISIPHGKSLSSMLDEQDIMPFYLKGNNACLVVRKASSDITDYKFIATAFQIHPTNQELMSNQGYPIITAPEMSVGVYDDCLLKSEDFIDQLQTLCMHLEESIPTSSKHHRKQAEVRDVASPKLVFEWLLPTLSDNVGHVPLTTIQKKVRNSVQWKDCLKPYRRSGLWMCIKTCLHLNLVWLFGIEKGTLLYKIFMLQLMSYLCLKSKGKLSHDLVMQMLSKMSVRMAKLETMIENYSTRTADKDMIVDIQACESLTNLVLQKSLEVVEKLRLGVDHWWSKTMETFSKENSFAMNFDRVDVKKDIRLSLPKSSEHLNGFKQLQHNTIGKLYEHKPPKDTGSSERDDFEYLCAIEDFIRKDMVNTIVQQDYSIHYSSELFDKLKQYHPKAMKFYKNDPVGKSRLFLAVFNIVRGLHMIAVKNMPLLAKYKSGVDVSTIQSLLLCSQADLQYAYELEHYFNEHDQSASNNSDFLYDTFSPQSFCVRYAEGNESMKKTLQQILDRMEQKKEQKLREVREMKEKYENLQREIRNSKCEYNVDKFGYSRHSRWCHKCNLVNECSNMNIFIYEKDLPEEPYLRNAIVFELNLPHSMVTKGCISHFMLNAKTS
ncbi:hypothetical protein C9374_001416 [Naegleria lovaniensis]|uniref:DUF6606 domain-containing protein n=1 Tax=Naegleria lovaniensis TaxID=51637 RepID=A0AA88KS77_NAELO|nr:uncharacterized protein C9374_001416 [Naegleria lovaniensis]KAG2387822.1 hypothetical protein C9374_001416 [Naegleria lovaniensis]